MPPLLAAGIVGFQANAIFYEGLATLFQVEISNQYELDGKVNLEAYKQAAELTKTFLQNDPSIIRTLREIEPCFAKWSPDLIRKHVSGDVAHLAEPLCDKFDRDY